MSAPIPVGHRTTATTQTGDEMEIAISCQDANRIIVALEAQVQTLQDALTRPVSAEEVLSIARLYWGVETIGTIREAATEIIAARAALAATEEK